MKTNTYALWYLGLARNLTPTLCVMIVCCLVPFFTVTCRSNSPEFLYNYKAPSDDHVGDSTRLPLFEDTPFKRHSRMPNWRDVVKPFAPQPMRTVTVPKLRIV